MKSIINYSNFQQLLIIIIQLILYLNSYLCYTVFSGRKNVIFVILITLAYFKALQALYLGNHKHTKINSQQIQKLKKDNYSRINPQYCKQCKKYVIYRDHHCIFFGQCVEKKNYRYFLSYLMYSHVLSAISLLHMVGRLDLIISSYYNLNLFTLHLYFVCFIINICAAIYFIFFTAGLLIASIRSIGLGIYMIQQIKKLKDDKSKLTRKQVILTLLWLRKGRKQLILQFNQNWYQMVGKISLLDLLIVQ